MWVSICICVPRCCTLADFVAGCRLSDRAREAEWQEGISIWNFNKDRKGKSDGSSERWHERCVCLAVFAQCTGACVLPSPPDFWGISFGEC